MSESKTESSKGLNLYDIFGIPESGRSKTPRLTPTSVDELRQCVLDCRTLVTRDPNSYRMERSGGSYAPADETGQMQPIVGPPAHALDTEVSAWVSLHKMNQVIAFHASDQIVTVQAGMPLIVLNEFLRKDGFEIPIGFNNNYQGNTVGDFIAMNLPHWNLARGGSWRDWIVKMKIVLASGEVVVSGADVVKNVTGFDLHKLMIGARGTLGVIAEVTLRIRPNGPSREYPPVWLNHGELPLSNPEGLKAAMEFLQPMINPDEDGYAMEYHVDEESCLLLVETFRNSKAGTVFDHAKYGFLWRSHVGKFALPEFSESEKKLMKRTKEIFDPTNKLNPGEFGFI